MGFDYMDNSNYICLPLWLLYFFTPLDTKDTIQRKLSEFNTVYKKTKFCALLARHDRLYNLRTNIYNLASKIGHVDCPGKLLHNDESLYKEFNNDKRLYLRQYYFNICPENSNSPGYVTEKLFEALYSGCIPIYNGGGGGRP
jgi:predicted PolB exonuclease-like 3'-5' exonuclease